MADVNLKPVARPSVMSVISINTGVYEVSVDTATGKTGKLMKQLNPPILCTSFAASRQMNVTYEQIVAKAKEIFAGETEPLKEFRLYPLMLDQLVKDPDYVAETDAVNYTVICGYALEERKDNPNKPIIAPTDEEGRTKAVEEALKPKIVMVPFVLAAPEDPRYMFYISYDFTPPGAVREWDSSVKEEDPLLNQDTAEGNPFINDTTEMAHISPQRTSSFITRFATLWVIIWRSAVLVISLLKILIVSRMPLAWLLPNWVPPKPRSSVF